MGATAAIIGLTLAAGSLGMQAYAQRKQEKAARKANMEAAEAEAEAQRELEAEKKEELKQRKMLVDNMRVQLGAGLGTSSVMGTKFKKSTAMAAPTSTLG
ncbi:MAG: hypothetical protein IKV10_01830 [Alphaproteobacteria bacterium]|nr:hypothetical protein [Alphaproteobacteria bacterium]